MRAHAMLLFFEGEDGIRDIGVTGVQTCALPILAAGDDEQIADRARDAIAKGARSGQGADRVALGRDGEDRAGDPAEVHAQSGRASGRESRNDKVEFELTIIYIQTAKY